MSLTSYLAAPSRDLLVVLANGRNLGRLSGIGKEKGGCFTPYFSEFKKPEMVWLSKGKKWGMLRFGITAYVWVEVLTKFVSVKK